LAQSLSVPRATAPNGTRVAAQRAPYRRRPPFAGAAGADEEVAVMPLRHLAVPDWRLVARSRYAAGQGPIHCRPIPNESRPCVRHRRRAGCPPRRARCVAAVRSCCYLARWAVNEPQCREGSDRLEPGERDLAMSATGATRTGDIGGRPADGRGSFPHGTSSSPDVFQRGGKHRGLSRCDHRALPRPLARAMLAPSAWRATAEAVGVLTCAGARTALPRGAPTRRLSPA